VYTARVTDFGYSTRFASENDLIPMPGSQPWCAPEHDRVRFTPAQARKMDVFSFGMLCVWLLFERYLSRVMPLPDEARWAEQYFQDKRQQGLSEHVLDNLKHNKKLEMLAQQLIRGERNVDNSIKQALERLFNESLSCDPESRILNLREWFRGHRLNL
jgi:serine/threonine protein kinase